MTFKLLYRVGQAKQRRHLKTPADHRNGGNVEVARIVGMPQGQGQRKE